MPSYSDGIDIEVQALMLIATSKGHFKVTQNPNKSRFEKSNSYRKHKIDWQEFHDFIETFISDF